MIFAVLIGGIAGLWFDDPTIGGIIGLSMIVNLWLAGLAGTVLPVALDRSDVDPAVGSTLVLTTVTGVVGFLSFFWFGGDGVSMTNDPGILALWNDCAEEGMADYERWYMAQHLPERDGVTGFRFGRRYVRVEGDRRYFTYYELDRPEVLWSDEYLERLGNPTDWT